MKIQIFQMLKDLGVRMKSIEAQVKRIEEKMDFSLAIQRNHLIRIKNGEDVDDNMILMGKPYNDLTPQQAYEVFQNSAIDHILLDVSKKTFEPPQYLKGAIHIPLEELPSRYSEFYSKTTPILIISELGLRSIKAAELLVQKGYFNVNNISGGYKYWPGFVSKSKEQEI